MFTEYPGQIAAIILEPVKNDEPRDGFLEKLRERHAHGRVVLIFDEMIAAMKFDLRGAHRRCGVEPDLALSARRSATDTRSRCSPGGGSCMELGGLRHDKQRVFLLSQTHSSETIGLAAMSCTLEESRRVDVTAHIWATGRRLVTGSRAPQAKASAEHVRVIGFDCNPQILCTREDGTYWPELHTSSTRR